MDKDRDQPGPLSSEELARDRSADGQGEEGGTFLSEEDAGGHTLPASEQDDARLKSGRGVGGSLIMPPD